MAYYVRMEVWCEYGEETTYFKFEESEFPSREKLEFYLDIEGHEMAHTHAEGYEYLVFGWGFDLEAAIDEGEITEEEYEQEMEWYYSESGYFYEFVSEEEYMDNEEYWA